MTTDLSALPQHVREAIERVDYRLHGMSAYDAWLMVRAELLRTAARVQELERERDHWHEYADDYRVALGDVVSRAEHAESELAALRKRVIDAPEGRIVCGRANSFGGFHVEIATDSGWHSGQRVALLTVEDKA